MVVGHHLPARRPLEVRLAERLRRVCRRVALRRLVRLRALVNTYCHKRKGPVRMANVPGFSFAWIFVWGRGLTLLLSRTRLTAGRGAESLRGMQLVDEDRHLHLLRKKRNGDQYRELPRVESKYCGLGAPE